MTDIVERLRSRKLCKDGVSRQPEKVKREAADTIEALRSEVTDLQNTIVRLTRELGEARDAEAAEIAAWLADDASQTDSDLRGLHRRKLLTPTQTLEWEAQIAAKAGIASAIARHEHRKD